MRRRTKFAAAVVITIAGSGCHLGTENPPVPEDPDAAIDAPPDTGVFSENPPPPAARVESYDVLVSAQTVRVLPRYTADLPFCMPTGVDVLPAVGECNEQADGVSASCGIDSDVTEFVIDSVTATPNPDTKEAALTVNTSASSVLHLDGAFGPIDVPLHASGLPTPTLSTVPATNGVDISWTTDVPAASTLVEVTAGLTVQHCQVAASPYHLEGMAPSTIRVQPFLAVETTTTAYGDIRVWRGNGKATQ